MKKKLKDRKCNKYKLFVFVDSIDLEKIEEENASIREITHHLSSFAAEVYKEVIEKKVCNSYLNKS